MGNVVTLNYVLESETLPTLPAVAAKILAVTENEDRDISEIASIIAQDASLSSRILKAVNSPLYGLGSPVGTIRKAVSILGIDALRSLALSFSLLTVGRGRKEDSFDYARFWEHSLAVAVTSRRLLKELGTGDEEEGFIAGLLGNMGEMLLARACPERYRWVLQAKTCQDQPLEAVEREILGIDHGKVGAEIARRWRFPPFLQVAIAYHHSPEEYPGTEEEMRRLVHVIHLAGILADMFHSPDPRRLRNEFVRRSGELLGLGENVFQSLADGVHEEVGQTAAYFGMNVELERSIGEILQDANLRLGQISLNYEQMKQELIRNQLDLIQLNRALQGGNDNVHRMAEIDSVTGIYNHRYLQTFLQAEMIRSSRHGEPLTLVLVDVDDFKGINTTCGRQCGDHILREMGRLLRDQVRVSDLVARHGGDEFTLVLPGANLEVALKKAQTVQETLAEYGFGCGDKVCRITVSIGIASRKAGEHRAADLHRRAERAMQEAGKGGKGRIVVADGTGSCSSISNPAH